MKPISQGFLALLCFLLRSCTAAPVSDEKTGWNNLMKTMKINQHTNETLLGFKCTFQDEGPEGKKYAAPRNNGRFECINTDPTSFNCVKCSNTCRLPKKGRKYNQRVETVYGLTKFEDRDGRKFEIKLPVGCQCVWKKGKRGRKGKGRKKNKD